MDTEEYVKEKADLEKEINIMREHLENHKPIFRTAIEYGLTFSKNRHISYGEKKRGYRIGYAGGSGTVRCVYLDLFLAEDDSIIKDVGPIIEEMKEHPRYKFYEETDYIEMGWKGWDFRYTNGDERKELYMLPKFLVRAFFEEATKCRKVCTGEFTEVMKTECEE